MENPFKFGTIVDNDYFTDRVDEQIKVKAVLNSRNHLVQISPRRFGKSSLIRKTAHQTGRPVISINMQQVTSAEELASMILRNIFKIHKWEKTKHLLANFRIIPTISINPVNDEVEFGFHPSTNYSTMIEDAFALIENVSEEGNRIIVIFDEFQEIMELEKGLDKKLRAILQEQEKVNYIFMGSEESMMTSIFEDKKSPFYHFGVLMHLKKIPYQDFKDYVSTRLNPLFGKYTDKVTTEILEFTRCHPYYTQQLAYMVWDSSFYRRISSDTVIRYSIETIMQAHELDYERLWMSINRTDRKVLRMLSKELPLYEDKKIPNSTIYSSIKKLLKKGILIKQESYEFEDPFFKKWIINAESQTN